MKIIFVFLFILCNLSVSLIAQTTNPRYFCYNQARLTSMIVFDSGNAWMNGENFVDALKAGGKGAALGLGTGAVGGAAGGWFSTTSAGQKVGSWMGEHSKGRFFDRKNPKSPYFTQKTTSIIIEDIEVGFPAYDDGVHKVPANTQILDLPGNDMGGMNVYNHSFKYSSRVRMRGVQDPGSHNFPYSYDDAILSTQPILKNNGYQIFQQTGTVNGKNGVFEIGVTKDGIIDHRFFRGFN